MSYILDGVAIKGPHRMEEMNSTQVAQQRTLAGSINRDYFGSNKRVWALDYTNIKKADYDTINTIYQSYLTLGTAKSWSTTETNYTVAATTVHVDLQVRRFSQQGVDYISDFTLTLTEA